MEVNQWISKEGVFKGWFNWTAKEILENKTKQKEILENQFITYSQMSKTIAFKNLKYFTGIFPLKILTYSEWDHF